MELFHRLPGILVFNMKRLFNISILATALFLISCEKEITVDLPQHEEKLVVEGSIEQGMPPFVILTKTVGYFEPTDLNTLKGLFIHGAEVKVSNGSTTVQLDEICTDQLPDSLLPSLAELIGVSLNDLKSFGFCVYTTLNTSIYGEVGKTYDLTIKNDLHLLSATTTIPTPVPADLYWFKTQPGYENLGYLWFRLSDPPALGNAYRMFTQRKGKDSRYIPVFGSVYEDKFINGETFDGFYIRGNEPNSIAPDDLNDEADYYRLGDTILIKFCSIDLPHYYFWRSFETEVFNNGNPFAAPSTIQTNIEGGLGIWGGYGVTYDTLVAVE